MQLAALIPSLLNTLLDGRVYWNTTPPSGPVTDENGAVLSFAIAQLVGGADYTYIDQSRPATRDARVQITSFDPDPLVSEALAEAIASAILTGHSPADIVGSPTAIYDPDHELDGKMQIFLITYTP